MNPDYQRVIPRDLFNEAKLLKCMGRLTLLIHDGMTPVKMKCLDNGEPFKIALMDEGSLTVMNLDITINDERYLFKTTYNSKDIYPFYLEHDDCEYTVFDDNGEFHTEFIDFCKNIIKD